MEEEKKDEAVAEPKNEGKLVTRLFDFVDVTYLHDKEVLTTKRVMVGLNEPQLERQKRAVHYLRQVFAAFSVVGHRWTCAMCHMRNVSPPRIVSGGISSGYNRILVACHCEDEKCRELAKDLHIRATAERGERNCVNCGRKTTKHCAKCRHTYYCSAECQKVQWSKHKLVCQAAWIFEAAQNYVENHEEGGEGDDVVSDLAEESAPNSDENPLDGMLIPVENSEEMEGGES